jgi:hypothetical protein
MEEQVGVRSTGETCKKPGLYSYCERYVELVNVTPDARPAGAQLTRHWT